MGLFSGETLEEKKERYFDENIDKIGLKNLSPEEREQIKEIIYLKEDAIKCGIGSDMTSNLLLHALVNIDYMNAK